VLEPERAMQRIHLAHHAAIRLAADRAGARDHPRYRRRAHYRLRLVLGLLVAVHEAGAAVVRRFRDVAGASPRHERGADVQQPLDSRPRRSQFHHVRRAVAVHAPRELERPREHRIRRGVHDQADLTSELGAHRARKSESRLRDVSRHGSHARHGHVHLRERCEPAIRIAHQHARLQRAIALEQTPQHRAAQKPRRARHEDDAPRARRPVTRHL
jgi:hypothetical protein